ncbi:hypothetical protein SAMN05421508_104102 [Caenispirillum bisanense]|uniref:Uncharacterized protein n=1 Tax=Caenispirillum bisanense TaxID=414052 RepID=A0A286GGT6_9PROT|nr:hypothetical protein SAMN05421508_104102 [Caenispirillum bisanense]
MASAVLCKRESLIVNTLSSWISGTLMVVMGLLGLLFTSRAEDGAVGAMGLIMFGFAVFYVWRLITNGGYKD